MFTKITILMLENICWVKQKSGKKMEAESNLLSFCLKETSHAAQNIHKPVLMVLTNTKHKG